MKERTYTTDQVMHEIKSTGAVMSRKHDIKYQFSGQQAYTDGKVVNIPALASGMVWTFPQLSSMRGFNDHETAHNLYSDFGIIPSIKRYMTRNKKPITMAMTNALEDCRIERLRIRDYAGSRQNLSDLGDLVNGQALESLSGKTEELANPLRVGPVAATWIGRLPYSPDSSRKCLDMLDDELIETLTPYVDAAIKCSNTREVLELAKELENKLLEMFDERAPEPEDEQTPPPPPPPPGKDEDEDEEQGDEPVGGGEGESESEEQEDDDDETDTGEGDDEGEGEDDGTGEGDGEEEDGDDGDSESGEDDGESGDKDEREPVESERPNWTNEPYNPEVNEAIEIMVQPDEDDVSYWDRRTYHVGQNISDRVWFWDEKDSPYTYEWPAPPYLYPQIITETAGTTAVIRQRLSRAIMGMDKRGYETGLEQGRLDTRRLSSVMSGRTNVFKRTDRKPDMNTSVLLLVDMSGSMHGTKMNIATQSVISILEALEPTGCETMLAGFFTGWRDYSFARGEKSKSRKSSGTELLVENTDYLVFKRFSDRLARARNSVASMIPINERWGVRNNDDCAVKLSGDFLSKRPTDRKILLTFSDGYANAEGVDVHILQNATADSVKALESQGIETIGVGIQSKAVTRVYDNHVVVQSLAELSGEAMDKLSQLLLGVSVKQMEVA